MKSIRKWQFAAILIFLSGLIVGPILITQAQSAADNQPLLTATVAGEITYQTDWKWGRAVPTGDGTGWRVTNDLGYQIEVEQGYLVSNSLELIACRHTDIAAALLKFLLPQVAYAGHGDNLSDPSKLSVPTIESLAIPQASVLGTVPVVETAYCEAHYLIAPAFDSGAAAPDIGKSSLVISGKYLAPEATQFRPFTITSQLAWGTITPLVASDGRLEPLRSTDAAGGPTMHHIQVMRNLDSLFEGIDFEQMSQNAQAKAVLRALTNEVQIVYQ